MSFRAGRVSFVSFAVTVLAAFAAGCSGESSGGDDETDDALERGRNAGGESMTLKLQIAESTQLFTSKALAFSVADSGEGAKEFKCRDRSFYLDTKGLYKDGWSPDRAGEFAEAAPNERGHEYPYASCRDEKTEIIGWFAKERDIEFIPSEQLLDEDYKPTQLPLILRRKEIGSSSAKYYTCDSEFEKRETGRNDSAIRYDISVKCKSRSAPSKKELGPLDFIDNPGAYASVASYKPWQLPSVPSNAESFEKVKRAFAGKIAEGTYSGAMSTLSKTCKLKVDETSEGISVDHTIDSSNRTRRLSLKAADLLGFVEGDLYEDPIRVSGEPIGKFAAAEFRDDKGGSYVVRFEENTTLDAKVVRINGAEAYCRRLVR